MLTACVGLQERTVFRHGSALDLPFEAATFEAVWTQGVLMNISDKARFFAEAFRVLRPGGLLAFQASLADPVPGSIIRPSGRTTPSSVFSCPRRPAAGCSSRRVSANARGTTPRPTP